MKTLLTQILILQKINNAQIFFYKQVYSRLDRFISHKQIFFIPGGVKKTAGKQVIEIKMQEPTYRKILICILIIEFWISGLFVLSVIFTQDEGLDDLTLCTFIAYAVGSFLAGILSDLYGRKPLFLVSSLVLVIAAAITVQYQFYGYVLANLVIGPLNNLTFVYINEVYPRKAEAYTIYVLIGWASSEITLGSFFYLFGRKEFYFFLLGVTLIYTICVVLYLRETDEFLKSKTVVIIMNEEHDGCEDICQNGREDSSNAAIKEEIKPLVIDGQALHSDLHPDSKCNKISQFCRTRVIPRTLRPLIGCSVLMFTMQMFYYRTQFTLDTFGISLELNTIVVGCTQVIANILFTKILQSMKRKQALRILLIALMVFLVFLIFSTENWMQTVIEGFMRLFDTGIMIVLGVYLPELFPIDQRGRGTNFVMSFGVIGSGLNGKVFSQLPFWSLELFLLSAFSMTLLLKETHCSSGSYGQPPSPQNPSVKCNNQIVAAKQGSNSNNNSNLDNIQESLIIVDEEDEKK